jgi:preprotein translocase subunit SecG
MAFAVWIVSVLLLIAGVLVQIGLSRGLGNGLCIFGLIGSSGAAIRIYVSRKKFRL